MKKNFFEFIAGFCEKLDLNIIFSSKNGIVTLAIFFNVKDDKDSIDMPNITLSGTAADLEANFFDALTAPISKTVELVDNIEFFNKQLKRIADEKEKKTTKTKTPAKTVKAVDKVVEPEEAPVGQTGIFDTNVPEPTPEPTTKPVEAPKAIVLEKKEPEAVQQVEIDLEDDY